MQPCKKIYAVKRNTLFRAAYSKGQMTATKRIAVYILKNRAKTKTKTLLGITVSKKYGKAVQRNRAKRIIREAYRHLMPQVKDGYIIIVVARHGLLNCTSAVVEEQLREILVGASLLCEKQ